MKGKLLNSTVYNGKQYTLNDVVKFTVNPFGPEWYGGRVRKFGTTNEGIFLCLELYAGDFRVIDIFIPDK